MREINRLIYVHECAAKSITYVEWEADNISFELNEYDDEACDAQILSRQKRRTTAAAVDAADAATTASTSDMFAIDDAEIEENERKIRQLEAEFDRDAADDADAAPCSPSNRREELSVTPGGCRE